MIDWEQEARYWQSRWMSSNAMLLEKHRQLLSAADKISRLERSGCWSDEEEVETLLAILDGSDPRGRVTRQRREIANLHKVIRRLREEIAELRAE